MVSPKYGLCFFISSSFEKRISCENVCFLFYCFLLARTFQTFITCHNKILICEASQNIRTEKANQGWV